MKSLFICTSIFLLVLSPMAKAQTAQTVSPSSVYSYDVYAGGIHALSADLTLKVAPKKYDIALEARTEGILKRLADWSGSFTSKGNIAAGQTYPLEHKSVSVWKGKPEAKTFIYNGKGGFVSYKVTEADTDKTPKDLDLSLAKDTTDLLSSTLRMMMHIPSKSACEGKELIFDGDRNYRLNYTGKKTETLAKTDFNIYSGDTIVCTVEVVPEKGKWRKKPRGWLSIQEQGRQVGALPTIWFGKATGQDNLYIPVKIRIQTDYGVLFMHLTGEK